MKKKAVTIIIALAVMIGAASGFEGVSYAVQNADTGGNAISAVLQEPDVISAAAAKTLSAAKKPVSAAKARKVYWVASGKVYHLRRNCRTLARSKKVYSGTIKQSGKKKCCKVCG